MAGEQAQWTITVGIQDAIDIQLLLDEEERLTRAIAEVRAIELDAASDDHARSDVAWREEDAAEAASETFDREAGFGLIEDFTRDLSEVAAARRRVTQGTYGVCESCGADIARERLAAIPATRWCVQCARRREYALSGPLAAVS